MSHAQSADARGSSVHVSDADEADRLLGECLRGKPSEITSEIDDAERGLVRFRDGIINELRAHPNSDDAPRLRAALVGANQAMSLVVGVEYPAGGIQIKFLEQARATV